MPEFSAIRLINQAFNSSGAGDTRSDARGGRERSDQGVPLYLRDSHHAARKFTISNENLSYQVVPRPKFLFWIKVITSELIPDGSAGSGTNSRERDDIAFVIKYIDKPKITPKVEEMNQYNKKRLIQTGVDYEPLTMRFHDDVSGIVIDFFRRYMRWYYGDFRYPEPTGWDYDLIRNPVLDPGGTDTYGFSPNGQSGEFANYFIKRLELYQFYGGKFDQVNFLNPKIISFDSDSNDYEVGNVGSEINMQFRYEAVNFVATAVPLDAVADDYISEMLLNIGDYYQVPTDFINESIIQRRSRELLGDIVRDVTAGRTPDFESLIKGVVRNSLPITKADLGGLGTSVFRNVFRPNSTLNSFGNYSYGGTSPQTTGTANSSRALQTRGNGNSGGIFDTIESTVGGFAGSVVDAAGSIFNGGIGSSVVNAATNVFDGAGDLVNDVFGGAVASSASDSSSSVRSMAVKTNQGTQLTNQGLANLNSQSRPTTQYGINTSSNFDTPDMA
ncbi:MAG: hypothetical protein WC284_13640 [Candidimonas sp.]